MTPASKAHRNQMVPRGLETRTLRLLAARSNQLSYETLDFEGCRIIRVRTANCATATDDFHSSIQHIFFGARAFLPWQGPRPIPGDFLGIDMRRGTAHEQWVGPAAPFLACPQSIGKLAQNKRLPPSSCGVCARGVCHSRAVGLFIHSWRQTITLGASVYAPPNCGRDPARNGGMEDG